MTPEQRATYVAARRAMLAAQSRYEKARTDCGDNRDNPLVKSAAATYGQAHETLLAATAPIKDTVNKAWDANRQAIQSAAAAVADAVRERTRVETQVGMSAVARNPARPVLSADELAQAQSAHDAWIAARIGLAEAQATFKAGVTADQLDKVT